MEKVSPGDAPEKRTRQGASLSAALIKRVVLDNGPIDFTAPEAVRAALDEIGRTEAVAVSPGGSRLALAAFAKKRVYVFSLAIKRSGGEVYVQMPAYVCLSSKTFREPHGCTFLDEDHLLICDRGGDATVVRVPEPQAAGQEISVDPLLVINGKGYLRAIVKTPGSAAAYGIGDSRYQAFVCSDQWNFITSHVITLDKSAGIVNEGIRIQNTLQIPDGISVSPDRQWIAVSNHVQGNIQLFRNSPDLNRQTPPAAILEGSVCPHGVSFDGDGNVYVADAASPYIHRYQKPRSDWGEEEALVDSFRLLSNEDFYKGRYAGREGGIKGIHVDQGTNVLITTHKLGTLEFRDLQSMRESEVDAEQLESLQRERDAEITRTKTDVLRRRWNLASRLWRELDAVTLPAMANIRAVKPLLVRLRLQRVNRRCRESLLDPAGPVVSMTSHSTRIAWAHLAIESIARGTLKPKRIILWLSDEEAGKALPDTLRRLEERGLEVRFTPDVGPHTKYFPYVASEAKLSEPLVTADDDIIYTRNWLAELTHARELNPTWIHCHRARRMRLNPYHFEPYGSWGPATDTEPSPLNFFIGASGVIYPPEFLRALRDYGTAFRQVCPKADDIWLNRVAYREGFHVAQVASEWLQVKDIPASQSVALYVENINDGGNQLQLAATYSPEDRANLFRIADA
jgi:sugar lactone lactonase YvrE